MNKILIIEDDKELNNGIAFVLRQNKFEVVQSYTKQEAITKQPSNHDLIVLDINLPDGHGLDLCQEIRKKSTVPVLFLTANDTEEDIIKGFQAGCDDYIAKPFSIEILKQRIQAILRRSTVSKNIFIYKNLKINYNKRSITLKETPIHLTTTEYKILELLTKNYGQVLTRSMLIEQIWDTNENFVDENALSVNIRRLRQKLEDDQKEPIYIITVFGIGYTLGE